MKTLVVSLIRRFTQKYGGENQVRVRLAFFALILIPVALFLFFFCIMCAEFDSAKAHAFMLALFSPVWAPLFWLVIAMVNFKATFDKNGFCIRGFFRTTPRYLYTDITGMKKGAVISEFFIGGKTIWVFSMSAGYSSFLKALTAARVGNSMFPGLPPGTSRPLFNNNFFNAKSYVNGWRACLALSLLRSCRSILRKNTVLCRGKHFRERTGIVPAKKYRLFLSNRLTGTLRYSVQ